MNTTPPTSNTPSQPDNHPATPPTPSITQSLHTIATQLERIGDLLTQPPQLAITTSQALQAWGLRIYETEYLTALRNLGIEIIQE